MVSRVQRYFLEIKDFSKLIDLNLPENHKIILDDKKDFQLNKFFYKQIGVDHYWRDRLLWSDKEWIKYVTNKNLETHVLKKGEDLVAITRAAQKILDVNDKYSGVGVTSMIGSGDSSVAYNFGAKEVPFKDRLIIFMDAAKKKYGEYEEVN